MVKFRRGSRGEYARSGGRQWGDTPRAIARHVAEDAVIERYNQKRQKQIERLSCVRQSKQRVVMEMPKGLLSQTIKQPMRFTP
jgi:response regulator of citrate/malate metabolism